MRQFVIPAMIKLMYCCGLRPAEARNLRVNDVDLDIGRLNIMESKQHRSRIVMMADDVTEMLSDCNTIVTSTMPEREPFFPQLRGQLLWKERAGEDVPPSFEESWCYGNRPTLPASL